MLTSFFVAIDTSWMHSPSNGALLTKHRSPLGIGIESLEDRCSLFIKFRSASDGKIHTDTEPCRLQSQGHDSFVASEALARELREGPRDSACGLFYFEGSSTLARCVYYANGDQLLGQLQQQDPSARLVAYDLPPAQATVVDSTELVRALLSLAAKADPELFAPQAAHFLNGPHILDQLLAHLMELKVEEAPNFLTVAKGIADQLRGLLEVESSTIRVHKVRLSHSDTWAEVYGTTLSFADGGAARITALPGVEPAAMRVGTYSVIPGEISPEKREIFQMETRLIADMTSSRTASSDGETDRKRLQEATRYVLELLVALRQADSTPRPEAVFLHGPLVNQFVAYDDSDPNNLPGLNPEFLSQFAVDQEAVTSRVTGIPARPDDPRWNQFMAVYGFLLRRLEELSTPVVGVVERSTGSHVVRSVLGRLKHDGVVGEAYVKQVEDLMTRYRVTDSFLFGCLLAEGEYLTPVQISKNNPRRAHDEWKEVVRGYLSPFATVLKPSEAMPPIRLELNSAAHERGEFVARITYHTSRLLPQYAFPVGLDIVDKYAKVPDWISKGISSTMAASVLRMAMREGDARVFAQARHFLAGEPRDFFFRPSV